MLQSPRERKGDYETLKMILNPSPLPFLQSQPTIMVSRGDILINRGLPDVLDVESLARVGLEDVPHVEAHGVWLGLQRSFLRCGRISDDCGDKTR